MLRILPFVIQIISCSQYYNNVFGQIDEFIIYYRNLGF